MFQNLVGSELFNSGIQQQHLSDGLVTRKEHILDIAGMLELSAIGHPSHKSIYDPNN